MAAYIRAADAIRIAFDSLAIIVHHCGHNGDRPRGHSSLIGALDAQIAVSRDAAGNIVAKLELSKDSEVGLQFVSRLAQSEVGVDHDGDAITSCVVEQIERAHCGPSKVLFADRGKVPPANNHVPAGVITVTIEIWREYACSMGISTSDEPRAKQKALSGGEPQRDTGIPSPTASMASGTKSPSCSQPSPQPNAQTTSPPQDTTQPERIPP